MGSVHLRLSVMMFLQYAIWGAWLPFAYRFFTQHRGIEGSEVGQLLSVAASGALIAPFLFGQIADRWIATEKLLALCHGVGALLVWQLARLTDVHQLMLFAFLYSLIYTPTISLTNSLALTHITDRDRQFGRVRVWGTIGWICAGIGVSQWLSYAHSPEGMPEVVAQAELAGLADSFRLSAILGIALGAFCWAGLPSTPPRPGSSRFAPFEALSVLKKRRMWALFLIAFPIACIHQFYFVHTELFLNTLRINDTPTLRAIFGAGGGGLMTVGQMSEIIVLAALSNIIQRTARKVLLGIGLLAYILRFASFAYLQSSTAAIISAIALHGLCFGCFIFVAYMIVDEESAPTVKASAQALFNFIVIGLGTIVGSRFAGEVSKICALESGTNYQLLYAIPMYVALTCLVLLMLLYPDGRSATARS